MKSALRAYLLRYLPISTKQRLRAWRLRRRRELIRACVPLGRGDMVNLLKQRLRVRYGTVLFIHNSVDLLNLTFPASDLLAILREVVGPEGTLVFPTFPELSSYDVLQAGAVFDVRKSPCYAGLLGEMARRIPGAVRSLHPTRSVVALGPAAAHLTANHHESPYPCDTPSPFYRLKEAGGQIIGMGVSLKNLTFVHTVDDMWRGAPPFDVYHPELFETRCINSDGQEVMVRSFAHDLARMRVDVSKFVRDYIDAAIAEDLSVERMCFFRVEAEPMFERMMELARQGITIYNS